MSWQTPGWQPEQRPGLQRAGGMVGMGGLACVLFLDLAAAIFLAWWGVALLVVLWLVLLVVAVRLFTLRPKVVAALPLVGLAAWVMALVLRVA